MQQGETAIEWFACEYTSQVIYQCMRTALMGAAEMAPARGRKIVSVLLYVMLPRDADFESVDEIFHAIQRTIPEDTDILFGCAFNGESSFSLDNPEMSIVNAKKI